MDIVVLSEIYPPAIGGSGVLMQNVYCRVQGYRVAVVTDVDTSPGEDETEYGMYVYRKRFAARRWGVLNPKALCDHGRTIRAVRSIPLHEKTVIHCGRALPEAVSVLLGYPLLRRRYVCWAHGEGITLGRTSREFAFLLKRVYRNAAAVLANSYNTRSLVKELGVSEQRIAVVHPGVDAGRFHPDVDGRAVRQRFAPQGGPLVLTVGRLQRRKGHDHALAVVASLRRNLPQIRYVIVGDGEERCRLDALVREYGLEDCVFFVNAVTDDELPAFYSACDIFLHPNRVVQNDIEGFGIVFLEAQACGKPVIGGRSGGVPETMIEGETGLLVSGEDIQETAALIRNLVEGRENRLRMGVAARRHVTEKFTWDRAAREVEEVHRVLVESDGV